MLRFFYNGIKGSDGKLQKCWYSDSQLLNHPAATLTIYARDGRFSTEVGKVFEIQNDSDMMTDYFEDDRIRVRPDHPLYGAVVEALAKCKDHADKRRAA